MEDIFSEVCKCLQHGIDTVLCTIVASSGSTPRKSGTRMAVASNGKVYGTVGGGNLENYAIAKSREVLRTREGFTREYHLAQGKDSEISMVCGGDATLEYTFLDSGKVDRKELERIFGESRKNETVYLFGGGHVGQELVPVLEHIGFDVVVFDNRPDYATADKYPKARKLIVGDYLRIADYIEIHKEDYIVIMTHGHAFDRDILYQTLQTDATYIGCIGSRRKIATTKAALMEKGITEENFARVHTPIGIELYADTPEEIAISIAAEMIRHRALEERDPQIMHP